MDKKRNIINSLREKLRQRNADTNFTNKFLYNTFLEQVKWLIKREVQKGVIYKSTILFQTINCMKVIETSTIDKCCPIKTNCKIYRTCDILPDMWTDDDGPIISRVLSIDGSKSFIYTTPITWEAKKNDPYNSMIHIPYVFYSNGYLWFPEYNPNLIKISAYFVDDVSDVNYCDDEKKCVPYLDKKFMIPDWIQAEAMMKTLELILGSTIKIPLDNQIDKNETRKD